MSHQLTRIVAVFVLLSLTSLLYAGDKPFVFGYLENAASTNSSFSNVPNELRDAPRFDRSDRKLRGQQRLNLAFDAGDSQVSAVQFTITPTKGSLAGADLSSCASALPASHIGGCKQKGRSILFYAMSMDNEALPGGMLGHISIPNAIQVSVTDQVMATTDGVELSPNQMLTSESVQ